jgi:hypothetical protein
MNMAKSLKQHVRDEANKPAKPALYSHNETKREVTSKAVKKSAESAAKAAKPAKAVKDPAKKRHTLEERQQLKLRVSQMFEGTTIALSVGDIARSVDGLNVHSARRIIARLCDEGKIYLVKELGKPAAYLKN